MTKKNICIAVIAALCSCLFSMACTQSRSPCLEPTSASLILHTVHYAMDTNTIVSDTTLPEALFVSLPDSNKTPLVQVYAAASTFDITLSPVADSCRWLMSADSTSLSAHGFDTLTFRYVRQLKFLSNACGFTYYFNLQSVSATKHTVDSLTILNAVVNSNVNTVHVQIYLHPDY